MAILGWLLGIFKYAFGFAVGWIKGGRVLIVAAVTAWIGFVVWACSQLGDSFFFVKDLLTSFRSSIEQIMTWLNSLPMFNVIYRAFALDVLLQSLLSQWSVIVAFLAFTLVSSVIGGAAVFAPLMIWRVMAKMLSSTTGGMVKT